jgi:hypothetical protein
MSLTCLSPMINGPFPYLGLGSLLSASPRGGNIHTARQTGRVKSTQASKSSGPAPPRVTIRMRTLTPGPPTDATIPNTSKPSMRRLWVASTSCCAGLRAVSVIAVSEASEWRRWAYSSRARRPSERNVPAKVRAPATPSQTLECKRPCRSHQLPVAATTNARTPRPRCMSASRRIPRSGRAWCRSPAIDPMTSYRANAVFGGVGGSAFPSLLFPCRVLLRVELVRPSTCP